MKVEYDKEAKAIYIKISDVPSSFGVVDHTKELVADTVMVDYLPSGEVYGIQIVGIENLEDITGELHWPENALFYQVGREIKEWWRNRSKWWASRPRPKERPKKR